MSQHAASVRVVLFGGPLTDSISAAPATIAVTNARASGSMVRHRTDAPR